ncbi:hypothetical protein DMB66_14745 [Actinoplanes sp. ATCC 53533]|nr:hypothetical protein DMB66_14745 [Actinoplanes sp. ATCC 53533]
MSLTLAVLLPTVFLGAMRASAATANPNAKYLQVYDNNVENLLTAAETCAGDWQDLIHYMVSQANAPDLFLVQQVDEAKLITLVAKMEDLLGLDYAWIISNRLAGDTIEKCNGEKQVQRNAIIYRTGRLAPVSGFTVSWQSKHEVGGSCVLNNQDRTVGIRMTFNDRLNTGKTVTAASLHWATGASDGPPCAEINATEAAAQVAAPGSSLTIMAGDTNVTDLNASNGWRPWYSKINGDLGGSLGYRDVIYDNCREDTDGSASAIKACLPWTLVDTDRRIDFMFGRLSGGRLPFIGSEHTITFNEGDAADQAQTGSDNASLNYSEHRAVMARIHYNTTNT